MGFRLRGSFVQSRWRCSAHREPKDLARLQPAPRAPQKEEAALLTKSGFHLGCVCVVSLEVDQRTKLYVLEVFVTGEGVKDIGAASR